MYPKLILIGLFVGSMILMSWRHDRKKKVLFFGDSITEQGVKPGGYVTRVDSLMRSEGLVDKYEIIGAGISGNKVYDLYLRMENDVLAQSPDIVVIFIGVNDVWHKRSLGTGTDFDKFGKFYEAIVHKLRAANIKVIVCTPAAIGERNDNSNELDGDMNLYSNWIRGYAAKEGLDVVDLRKLFIDYNLHNNPSNKESGILTRDKVHLNDKGNELVAEAMWNIVKGVKA